jgi:hypothetical protein
MSTDWQVELGDYYAKASISKLYVTILRLKVEILCAFREHSLARGTRKGTLAGALRVWVTRSRLVSQEI